MKNMKKLLLSAVLVFALVLAGNAQEKKMSIGLGLGVSSVSNSSLNYDNAAGVGFNFFVNYLYNLNTNISLGLEINGNIAVIAFNDGDDFEVTSITGYLPKFRYRFGDDGGVRFFVGAMVGLYRILPGNTSNGDFEVFDAKMVFGGAPEIGAQFGRSFHIATSVHFPGKYKYDSTFFGTEEFSYFIWQFNVGWNINFVDN